MKNITFKNKTSNLNEFSLLYETKLKIIQDFFDFSKISNIDILLKNSKNNGVCNCKQKRIYLGD